MGGGHKDDVTLETTAEHSCTWGISQQTGPNWIEIPSALTTQVLAKQLLAFVRKDHQFLLRDSSITDWLFVVSDLTYLCDDCNASSCAFTNFQNARGQPFATAAGPHKVCAGSKSWWTVEGEGVIWEERSLVPQGSSVVVGLTGPGSFLMGLMSSYSGCHLWVPGESPSDQRQPCL